MPVVVVANPKGGVGKSTLSTNIAGYYASQGHPVILGDTDRQESAKLWLGLRPPAARPIGAWDGISSDVISRPPKGTTHAVLDTPAGLHGWRLNDVLKLADKIIVPLQPSVFDIFATRSFLDQLAEHRRAEGVQIGIVGMRVDAAPRPPSSCTILWTAWASRCWATCAIRRTTSTWRRMASRCLTWRPAAWRATWSSGRASVHGSILEGQREAERTTSPSGKHLSPGRQGAPRRGATLRR